MHVLYYSIILLMSYIPKTERKKSLNCRKFIDQNLMENHLLHKFVYGQFRRCIKFCGA